MTQKTILDAKREGRQIKDGEFKTACSLQHVISGAIVFGDVNDHDSLVYRKRKNDKRMYHLLRSSRYESQMWCIKPK